MVGKSGRGLSNREAVDRTYVYPVHRVRLDNHRRERLTVSSSEAYSRGVTRPFTDIRLPISD